MTKRSLLPCTSEIDGDVRRGGVAIYVGQRLLNNAEQRLLKL